MSTPDPAAGRPDRAIPDRDDLRLLAELINNPFVPVAGAAWNARMSQSEAAARLVAMAEHGLPLRLVAEGDRQALWRIAQGGPATGSLPSAAQSGLASSPPPQPGAPAPPPPQPGAPAPPPPPAGFAPPPPIGFAPPQAPPVHGTAGPGAAHPGLIGQPTPPPPTAVPPHERAITGAVPLGAPPFGPADHGSQPDAVPEPQTAAIPPTSSPSTLWGIPGTAGWARTEDEPPAAAESSAESSSAHPSESDQTTTVGIGTPPPDTEGANENAASADRTSALPVAVPFDGEQTQVGLPDWDTSTDLAAPIDDHEPAAGAPSAAAEAAEPAEAEPAQASVPVVAAPTGELPADPATGVVTDPGRGQAAPVPQFGSPPVVGVSEDDRPRMDAGAHRAPDEKPVTGLFGEHLSIALDQVIDPADPILGAAGFRLDSRWRSVLVRTVLRNLGPADFESVADLYLTLIDTDGRTVARAPFAVPGYPPHGIGVRANYVGVGWTVFQVAPHAVLASVRWSVRPDLPDKTVSWLLR